MSRRGSGHSKQTDHQPSRQPIHLRQPSTEHRSTDMYTQKMAQRDHDRHLSCLLELCEALKSLNLAYCLKPGIVVPGDPMSSSGGHRKVDLIVFNNGCHLVVDLQEDSHDPLTAAFDNYISDYSLFRSCGSLSLRFAINYVKTQPLTAAGLIWSCLNPEHSVIAMGHNWPETVKRLQAEETTRRDHAWKDYEQTRHVIGACNQPDDIH